MKRLEIIDSFGDKVVVEPELMLYTTYDFMDNKMPGLGIQFYSYDEDGFREPYATLTTNFGEFLSVKDCAYIDTNNNSFAGQLLAMGFCQDTGITKQSGFCTYPLWKFDKEFLKEIDVHGLYDTYSKKYDEYMKKGPDVPIRYREVELITNVVEALGVDCKIDPNSDGLVVWANDTVYYRDEFYRYMLAEVCEYDENGAVKGLSLDLCHDFYDLCEYNKVNYHDYNVPETQNDIEYVVTMSSGGGTVYDFMTCSSREEAEQVCEGYNWTFVDENEFEWSLDIDEREVSLDSKLVEATQRSEKTDTGVTGKNDIVKE